MILFIRVEYLEKLIINTGLDVRMQNKKMVESRKKKNGSEEIETRI